MTKRKRLPLKVKISKDSTQRDKLIAQIEYYKQLIERLQQGGVGLGEKWRKGEVKYFTRVISELEQELAELS